MNHHLDGNLENRKLNIWHETTTIIKVAMVKVPRQKSNVKVSVTIFALSGGTNGLGFQRTPCH